MTCPEVAGVDPRLVLYDRRHAEVYAEWLELLGDADAAEDAAQWALLSAAEGVEEDEVSRLVHAALPDLPVAARTALLLREREGLTYAEVAERLGVAQPTAERVVYVARMRLVEALRRIRQALNLAPLLGWLKSTAAGLTAAKGVAAVATLGAAAGLSALALPARDAEPAPRAPMRSESAVPTRVEPSAATVEPATRKPQEAQRLVPVASPIGPLPAVDPARPEPPPERTSEAPISPASQPASDNLSLAPVDAPEPANAPVVSPIAVPTAPAVPPPPALELPPVQPVEAPQLPIDVPAAVPELELPPLPLP